MYLCGTDDSLHSLTLDLLYCALLIEEEKQICGVKTDVSLISIMLLSVLHTAAAFNSTCGNKSSAV